MTSLMAAKADRSKSNRSPGKSRLKWTTDMRTVLLLLNDEFEDLELTHEELAALFNNIFKKEIASDGVRNGMTYASLNAQYQERNLQSHSRWAHTLNPSRAELARRQRFVQGLRAFITKHSVNGRVDILKLGRSLPASMITSVSGSTEAYSTPSPSPRLLGLENVGTTGLSTPADNLSPVLMLRSKRKRLESEGSSHSSADHTKRIKTTISEAASVIIPIQMTSPPISPRAPGRMPSRSQYHRRNGTVINASPRQVQKAQRPIVPVPEHLASPPVTLLFRFWDSSSAGINSNEGFTAGRFVGSEIVPAYPPSGIDHLLSFIESHVDRDSPQHSRGRPIASPFVSASNFFPHSLRLALRSAKEGGRQLRITVIDAERLDSRKVLHVAPFHSILKAKLSLNHGAWKYPGNHEFLVWDRIPKEAIIRTFTLSDLVQLCSIDEALSRTLRLEQFSGPGDYRTKIAPLLRAAQVGLSHKVICHIAKVCRLIGLTVASPLKHVEQIVGDVCKGWEFIIESRAPSVWAEGSAIFCDALRNGMSPTIHQQQEVRLGFLYGVRASLGGYNVLHERARANAMLISAREVGLEDPSAIILEEMRRAFDRIEACGEQQTLRYFSLPSSQRH